MATYTYTGSVSKLNIRIPAEMPKDVHGCFASKVAAIANARRWGWSASDVRRCTSPFVGNTCVYVWAALNPIGADDYQILNADGSVGIVVPQGAQP